MSAASQFPSWAMTPSATSRIVDAHCGIGSRAIGTVCLNAGMLPRPNVKHRFPLLWMHLQLAGACAAIVAGVLWIASRLGQFDLVLVGGVGLSALVALGAIFIGVQGVSRSQSVSWLGSRTIAALCAGVAAAFVFNLFLVMAVRVAVALTEFTNAFANPKLSSILFTATATAIIGGAFFYFRLRQRFLYGFSEAGAGIAIAGYRVTAEPGTGFPSETGFYIAVLTAGIYLVVRGLDNMHQAAMQGDKIAVAIVRRLRRTETSA